MGLYLSYSSILAGGPILYQESQLVYELISVINFLKHEGFSQNAKWMWLMGFGSARWKRALGRTCFSLRWPCGQNIPLPSSAGLRALRPAPGDTRRLFFYTVLSSCLPLASACKVVCPPSPRWISSAALSSSSSLLSHVVQATVPTSPEATAVARSCLPLTSPCSAGEQLFPVHTHTHTHKHRHTHTNQPSAALRGKPAVGAVCLHFWFIITVTAHTNTQRHMWSDVNRNSNHSALRRQTEVKVHTDSTTSPLSLNLSPQRLSLKGLVAPFCSLGWGPGDLWPLAAWPHPALEPKLGHVRLS